MNQKNYTSLSFDWVLRFCRLLLHQFLLLQGHAASMDETPEKDYPPEESDKRIKKKKKKNKKKKLNVRVEAITDSSDRAAPIVGYFPSGFDPLKTKNEGEDHKVRVFRNPKRTGRLEIVVSPRLDDGSSSNVEFVGSSYTGEAANPQVCKYAIGVLDKEKKSLRIVPIAANKVVFPL